MYVYWICSYILTIMRQKSDKPTNNNLGKILLAARFLIGLIIANFYFSLDFHAIFPTFSASKHESKTDVLFFFFFPLKC